MTQRTSNSAFLTVIDTAPLENVGWTARVLSERDFTSPIAEIHRYVGLGFTSDGNAEGGGRVQLAYDDRVFTDPLPSGETASIVEQEALWQILEDGQVRFEFLAEDIAEDILLPNDGGRITQIAGRGTGLVLEWAKVLPEGMPNPTSTERVFSMHPMAAWHALFLEAQADGYLTWVTPLFNAAEDSAGNPWGAVQELTVSSGTSLLTLLIRWAEANDLTWKMLPGFKLFVQQGGGNHREAEVVFTQHRAQAEHKRSISRREIANTVYVDSGDHGIAIASSSDSQTKWRKRATWVSAGEASDDASRSIVAGANLELVRNQKSSRTVKVPADRAGRKPFDNFDVHDWITIELEDGASESGSNRVVAISLNIGDSLVPEVELTLQSRVEARALRLQRALDRLGAESTPSQSSTPIPVSKFIPTFELGELDDVDLTGLADGDGIFFDQASGLFKPGSGGATGLYVGVNAQTGTTYTPVLSDIGKMVTLDNAAEVVVTLPADAVTAFPVGARVDFTLLSEGGGSFLAGAGADADGTPSTTFRDQYSTAHVVKIAADTWIVGGDLGGATDPGGDTYYDEVMADSPAFYYPLDDVSTPTDATGNTTAAIDTGALGAAGIGDGATSWQGASGGGRDGGIHVDTSGLANPTAYTFEAIAIRDDATKQYAVLAWEGVMLIRVTAAGLLSVFTGNSWADQIGSSYAIPSSLGIHHYAVTWDGTTARVYLDGAEVASEAVAAGAMTPSLTHFGIGSRDSTSDNDWDGRIAGVAYHTTALSAARILAHAEAAGVA
ncbi:LamG-like jellyroll fold domain-containing protein [Agromyces sp. SYSU T00194]|uniref:LamG-like jellyroll fold domain-containing protein n=1 Tax=Agromyces chitinivorans TaxID=3158560 RepID=UPI00339B42CB